MWRRPCALLYLQPELQAFHQRRRVEGVPRFKEKFLSVAGHGYVPTVPLMVLIRHRDFCGTRWRAELAAQQDAIAYFEKAPVCAS